MSKPLRQSKERKKHKIKKLVKFLNHGQQLQISHDPITPSTSTAGVTSTKQGNLSTTSSTDSGQSTDSTATSPHGQILEAPIPKIFTFAELRSATKNFKPEAVLGEGGFGRVYKGWVDERTLSPTKCGLGMVIAVKKLKPESVQGFEQWQPLYPRVLGHEGVEHL